MWGQGRISQSPDSPPPPQQLEGDRRHAYMSLPRGTFTPALQARGSGEGVRKRYALHISEATAFAFKAEILLSEQSQQLRLGP